MARNFFGFRSTDWIEFRRSKVACLLVSRLLRPIEGKNLEGGQFAVVTSIRLFSGGLIQNNKKLLKNNKKILQSVYFPVSFSA